MNRLRHPLRLALALLVTCAAGMGDAFAAEVFLPAIGGRGGSQFLAPCPAGQSLAGFELRAGDDVDAIRPLCVTAYSSGSVTTPRLTTGSGLIQHYSSASREVLGEPYSEFLGDWSELPQDWHGGTGGGRASVVCPRARPIVVAMYVAAEGVDTVSVNNIHLYCGLALPSQALDANPSAIFDAPGYKPSKAVFGISDSTATTSSASQRCPDGQVAVGIHGRSGVWLDALGLVCDAPRVTPAMALGRVETTPGTSPPTATKSICESAESARARNSPAAPGLEAQCRASQPGTALGKVPTPANAGPPVPICDAAKSARARNSPAAPGLEAQCRALGGGPKLPNPDELEARGGAIVAADALLSAMRELQPEGANRRGFDIGIAACEGHTAWGPGKQQTLDSLAPAEQEGFKTAASYALDRNRNAKLATTGFEIDALDPELTQARAGEADGRYGLGFDIATGIFGDPKLGAQGNTATGPGSLGIRDALSAAAQRGFNASMKMHLGRRY